MDPSQQLHILRDLLAIERANNEQHRQNNLTMKRYLQHLQDDYLKLQSDLVQALEYGHKLKAQKETQINCLETNLKQKDVLIEQLRTQLGNLDEAKLRADLKAALDKQLALHQLEQEQLRQQIATNEQQLCRERVNNSQLLQQFQEKLDDQVRLHEREMETMKSRLVQGQEDLERVLSEPQNLIVKALREDKSRLEGQVDELELALEETRNKYDSLRKRLELLLLEQERVAQQSQEELDKMQQVSADQRRALTELRLELDDKHEIIQVLDFNVERSEKRVKNLLAALKNKEVTYRELIGQTEAKHRLELEKLGDSLQLSEKRFVELESELSAKQNELVRLRLEQENQLESLRNDRDERLAKMAMEKTQLAKEVQAVELKLARECEQSNQRSKLIEQLQKEVQQFREESKRLSIELTKSEAKLYAKQQELQAAQDSLAERDANQVVDLESQSKLATTQRELDDERGHSKRLKTNLDELKRCNEKLQAKLRIAESNLDKTRSAINREHEKMMREYEKKMESIRSEQASFDKNKLRYKRYGFKLKKYCEHLKRVHAHLCTPNNCGYIIEPNAAARNLVSSVGFGLPAATTITRSDSVGLLDSDGDEQCSDSPYYDDIISGDDNGYHYPDTNTMPSKPAERTPNRFIIKRTGLSPAISSPILKTKHQQSAATNPISRSQNQCSRVPLRSKSTNLISFEETKARNAPNSCDNSNLLATTNTSKSKQPNCEENSYYNTREESCSVKVTSSSKPETERSRMNKLATSARSRRVVTGTQQKQQMQQQVLRTLI